MKITIEWTVEELKEFYENKLFLNNPSCEVEKIEKDKIGWITTEWDWIVFRYKWKERSLYKENEKKSDWDEYFTFDEAVEYCKNLNNRHLPSVEERQELLKTRCEWKGYKMDWTEVYSCDNKADNIWKEFAKDFKLPLAGYRYYSDAYVSFQGNLAIYWSSTPFPNNTNNAHNLYFNSSYINPQNYSNRAYRLSVRCFKNSYGPQTWTSWNQVDD